MGLVIIAGLIVFLVIVTNPGGGQNDDRYTD